MPRGFAKEIEKLAKEKYKDANKQSIKSALIYAMPPSIIASMASHPIEHKLYGQNKSFFPHLGARIMKGILGGGSALALAKYLEDRRIKKRHNNA